MAQKTLLLTASAHVGVGFWTSICVAFANLGGAESKNFSKKLQRVMNNVKKRLQEQMDQLPTFEFKDFRMVQDGKLAYTGTIIAIGPEEDIPESFKVNFYNAWDRKEMNQPLPQQEPMMEPVPAPVVMEEAQPEPQREYQPEPEPEQFVEPEPEPQPEPEVMEEPEPQPEPAPAPEMRKRFCPQCGQQVDINAAFCPQCGSRLAPMEQMPYPQPEPQPQPIDYEKIAEEGRYYYNEVKDYQRAFECFQMAAPGSLRAKCNLAYLCYYLGKGAKKNKKLAIQLLKECVDAGYPQAAERLEKVERNG